MTERNPGQGECHCRALTSVRYRALTCLLRGHACPSEAVSASKDGREKKKQELGHDAAILAKQINFANQDGELDAQDVHDKSM